MERYDDLMCVRGAGATNRACRRVCVRVCVARFVYVYVAPRFFYAATLLVGSCCSFPSPLENASRARLSVGTSLVAGARVNEMNAFYREARV